MTEMALVKEVWTKYRRSIQAKALYSAATVSLFLYMIIRGFTYDFPMSWKEEIFLFVKIAFTGTLLISLATIGCAGIYRAFVRIKRN